MPYDSIISRTDADTLIPTEQADAVIKAATQSLTGCRACIVGSCRVTGPDLDLTSMIVEELG